MLTDYAKMFEETKKKHDESWISLSREEKDK